MEEEEADGRILMDGQDSSNIQATHSKNETEACSVHPSTKNHDAHKTMTMGATTQQQTASRNINTASGDGKTESSTESMRISSSAPTVESKPLHLNARNANDSPRDTELLSKQGQEKSGSQDRKKTPDPKRPHDFLYGKELGAGAYARVLHCRDRRTHADYACKIIDRRFIIKEKKVQFVMMERDVMSRVHHPNIVRLRYTFRDEESLYFIMDLCRGGDLLGVIRHFREEAKRRGEVDKACPIDIARFYMAELVSALEYLHTKLRVVHRDLKPENVLLTEHGHLKLADFGSAKSEKNNGDNEAPQETFCGTAEYVSPEMINDDTAHSPADLWALGCILYQLLIGRPMLRGGAEYQTLQNVTNYADGHLRIEYPEWVPETAVDLIERLTRKDPAERLGAGSDQSSWSSFMNDEHRERYSYKELKNHPFFDGFDFEALRERQIYGEQKRKLVELDRSNSRRNQEDCTTPTDVTPRSIAKMRPTASAYDPPYVPEVKPLPEPVAAIHPSWDLDFGKFNDSEAEKDTPKNLCNQIADDYYPKPDTAKSDTNTEEGLQLQPSVLAEVGNISEDQLHGQPFLSLSAVINRLPKDAEQLLPRDPGGSSASENDQNGPLPYPIHSPGDYSRLYWFHLLDLGGSRASTNPRDNEKLALSKGSGNVDQEARSDSLPTFASGRVRAGVIMWGRVEKRRSFRPFTKTIDLVLTNKPSLEYFNPKKKEKQGEIPFTDDIDVSFSSSGKALIIRTGDIEYKLEDKSGHVGSWKQSITDLLILRRDGTSRKKSLLSCRQLQLLPAPLKYTKTAVRSGSTSIRR